VLQLAVLHDRSRAELHEQTHERGASGSAVEPEHDGVILGVVSGLEEPWVLSVVVANVVLTRVLTVEQVLVLLVVIKVTAVLLDLVNAQYAGVDLLHPKVELLQLSVNLTLLLALRVLDPDVLDVGTLDNVVPLAVMLARVWLRCREEGGLVEALRKHHGHLVPCGACLASERLEALLEVVERLRPRIVLELAERVWELEDLLLWRDRS
jgi:hypothetical protein